MKSEKSILKLMVILTVISALILIGLTIISRTMILGVAPNNILQQTKSEKEFKRQVSYDFDIPEFLLNERDIACKTTLGSNLEIYNTRFRFCVAPLLNTNVSVVGNYNEFEFDEMYSYGYLISEDSDEIENTDKTGSTDKGNTEDIQSENIVDSPIKYVRYRTDGKTTVVDWYTEELMYGIQMENYDGFNGMEALLSGLGIDINHLEKVDTEDTNTDSKDQKDLNESDELKSKGEADKEIGNDKVNEPKSKVDKHLD